MKQTEIFNQIESVPTVADFAIASGKVLFGLMLDDHEAVQTLIGELREKPELEALIVERIDNLLAVEEEAGLIHRSDIPIAIYLHALRVVDLKIAREVAANVRQKPQLFWARRIAAQIMKSPPSDDPMLKHPSLDVTDK